MRNLTVFIGTLFVLFVISEPLLAQPLLQLDEGRQNDLLTVRVSGLNNHYATVKVNDLNGKGWLSKQLWRKETYTAGFDLHDLKDGDYLVTLRSKRSRVIKPFTKIGSDLIFLQPKEMQLAEPEAGRLVNTGSARTGQLIVRINQSDDGVAVHLQLANLEGHSTSVGLISTDGIATFREEINGHSGYAKRLNLTGLSGQYILHVKTKEVSIMQFLEVTKGDVKLLYALSREKRDGESVLVASR